MSAQSYVNSLLSDQMGRVQQSELTNMARLKAAFNMEIFVAQHAHKVSVLLGKIGFCLHAKPEAWSPHVMN